jgi:hypothetical protein
MVLKEIRHGIKLGLKAKDITKKEIKKSFDAFVKAKVVSRKDVEDVAKKLVETSKREKSRLQKLIERRVKEELKKRVCGCKGGVCCATRPKKVAKKKVTKKKSSKKKVAKKTVKRKKK